MSHARILYPSFEILFGVRDASDTSIPFIRRLASEYPNVSIQVIPCTTIAPNAKVGSLIDLLQAARHPICVVNDSDITVPSNYLDKVVAPLENPAVGLVTCLYRAGGDSLAAKFEALGNATDFAPSALVAPLVGVNEFGLGSTLAFGKADVAAIGGFKVIGDYIADDYQLGKRISRLGSELACCECQLRRILERPPGRVCGIIRFVGPARFVFRAELIWDCRSRMRLCGRCLPRRSVGGSWQGRCWHYA